MEKKQQRWIDRLGRTAIGLLAAQLAACGGPAQQDIDELKTQQRQILAKLADIEKKIESHLKKREATELAQIARARAAVLPGGRPQERTLTVAGWLARYGPGLLDEVRAAAGAWYATALAGDPVGS